MAKTPAAQPTFKIGDIVRWKFSAGPVMRVRSSSQGQATLLAPSRPSHAHAALGQNISRFQSFKKSPVKAAGVRFPASPSYEEERSAERL
jgi:hypothetical protein